jgi:uncharacterized protein YuzE
MKLKVDHQSDALDFRLTDEAIFESEEVQPGVILDFDEQGRVVGVETLALSSRIDPDTTTRRIEEDSRSGFK